MIQRHILINSIIKNYNLINPTYLEIGVWTGGTFNYINTSNKDGVDPGQYCDCNIVNYKMTSDIFFNSHIQKKYDIIFIDGLHTAYQVTKDIYNSINNLNDGGWIILDDVFPHCEYEQERLDLRKSGPQTGDVWKAIYNILDTIKDISDIMYFEKSTERGNFIFKLKRGNNINIKLDNTIPIKNIDGWYEGNDVEWDKYTYSEDFNLYISKLYEINSKSTFLNNY
jgi:hypothetical protein